MSSGCADARYQHALIETNLEIVRAKNLHGPVDFNSIHEGYAVLLEEVEELWELVKTNPIKAEFTAVAYRDMLRKEALQVAAMAVRFAAELT